jgi:hypothetical protein
LSDTFFEICNKKIGKSKRYFERSLNKKDMVYNNKWGLVVPSDLLHISE